MIDHIDRKILAALQQDAMLSIAAISDQVGLSQTPCWKRIKRLEAEGYITGRVALLDRRKLGLNVTVFAAIRTNRHDEQWCNEFTRAVSQIPEVVEFYRLSGEIDYLLRIVCADIADYDRIYRTLIRNTAFLDVSSSFAMEQIKYTTELPLPKR